MQVPLIQTPWLQLSFPATHVPPSQQAPWKVYEQQSLGCWHPAPWSGTQPQVPFWQDWPGVQQFAPHTVLGAEHWHAPFTQVSFAGQAAQAPPPVPQAPAACWSYGRQVPFWQHSSALQQVLSLFGPRHCVSPCWQPPPLWHWPERQTSPAGQHCPTQQTPGSSPAPPVQSLPQSPQLCGSEPRLTHVVPHRLSPGGQTQVPVAA